MICHVTSGNFYWPLVARKRISDEGWSMAWHTRHLVNWYMNPPCRPLQGLILTAWFPVVYKLDRFGLSVCVFFGYIFSFLFLVCRSNTFYTMASIKTSQSTRFLTRSLHMPKEKAQTLISRHHQHISTLSFTRISFIIWTFPSAFGAHHSLVTDLNTFLEK